MCSSSLRWLALALLLAATGAQARELRVCSDPNNLPFSNDRGDGFENRIAQVLAEELGASLSYTWHAQRRGFLRETLKAGACDVVIGAPSNLEGVRTTRPYYRSTYVFVSRPDRPAPASFNDEALRHLTIGVQLIGDDGWNTPPAHALAKRGITQNVRGFMVYGDYGDTNPAARIIDAVRSGSIDMAVVWGPTAGYFAGRGEPLAITPVKPAFDGPQLPMLWDISVAVRKEDEALRQALDAALERRRAQVDAILADYRVPRLDPPARQARVQP